MVSRLISIVLFGLFAVAVIQLVNYSFTSTYKSIETSVEKPYAKAQSIYESTE